MNLLLTRPRQINETVACLQEESSELSNLDGEGMDLQPAVMLSILKKFISRSVGITEEKLGTRIFILKNIASSSIKAKQINCGLPDR